MEGGYSQWIANHSCFKTVFFSVNERKESKAMIKTKRENKVIEKGF